MILFQATRNNRPYKNHNDDDDARIRTRIAREIHASRVESSTTLPRATTEDENSAAVTMFTRAV